MLPETVLPRNSPISEPHGEEDVMDAYIDVLEWNRTLPTGGPDGRDVSVRDPRHRAMRRRPAGRTDV
jgi:hypothetical protein